MGSVAFQTAGVVTGLGVVSPIGIGIEPFAESLRTGRSGIAPVTMYNGITSPGGIGGEVKDFTEESMKKNWLKDQRKWIKVMCREIAMGSASATLALTDSGLDLEKVDRHRLGVEFGANLMFFMPDAMSDPCKACTDENGDFHFEQWGGIGMPKMEPLWLLKYLPNMPACHIAINADARGPSNSLTMDEASANATAAEALSVLRRGAADAMIVGTTGTRIHPTKAIHARQWDQVGYDSAHPELSCKPFDTERSGQVVGEGAATVIVETSEHAAARGAHVYGRLLAGASSCATERDGTPLPKLALVNAMRAALRQSGLTPADIGHVNAHGLGSRLEDQFEAEAIREIFGEHSVPVTAYKGFYGNAGASSGSIDLVATFLSLRDGVLYPALGSRTPDPTCGLNLVVGEPRKIENKHFMKLSYTRRGQASVLIGVGA
ncbi:MAG: beta-ketoacyl-[acyl-carrier-protein] synthase family protein [Planctomycetota bacterium]|nr:MAG: beta-ketoacyl-[acyl-carrier-protein] synthase family protein [Planctomycetota bacterium]